MYSYQETSQRGQVILNSKRTIGKYPAVSVQLPVEDALLITNCVSMVETIAKMTDFEVEVISNTNVKQTLNNLIKAARRAIEVK